MMVTQGAMKTSPPNPEGSSTQCELDRGAHEGAAMGEGDPGTCSKLLTGVSLALPRTPSPVAKQKSGGDDMRISPQESEKPKGTEVEDNKHGGEGKLRMDKYAQLGGDVRHLSTDLEGEEMADHTAGRAKRRTTSPQTKSGGAEDGTQIQSGTMEGEAELGGTPQLASTEVRLQQRQTMMENMTLTGMGSYSDKYDKGDQVVDSVGQGWESAGEGDRGELGYSDTDYMGVQRWGWA